VHLHVPAVLLSLVYAAAVAVAVTDPGRHALAGLVVLAGLVTRWAVRHRRTVSSAGTVDVPTPQPTRRAAPAAPA
jgi:hypothetical protein